MQDCWAPSKRVLLFGSILCQRSLSVGAGGMAERVVLNMAATSCNGLLPIAEPNHRNLLCLFRIVPCLPASDAVAQHVANP